MMNPWTILGVIAAWLISLSAVGYWQNQAGHVAERGKWEQREVVELTAINNKIEQLNREARDKELLYAANMSMIATGYEKEMKNAKRKTDERVADILSGSLVLRDPAASKQACGSETGSTPAPPGERDGETGGGFLSEAAAVFLISEAGRCDQIVEQLTAAQNIITGDRE